MTKINICLSCDDNYAKYAGVVIASILFNARNDDEISEEKCIKMTPIVLQDLNL